MKAWPLILMCFVLSFILYIAIWSDGFHFTVNRKMMHGDCGFTYQYTYLTFDVDRQWINKDNKDCARVKLTKCLCEEYLKNQDADLKDYIWKFYQDNPEMQTNYARRVVFQVNSVLLLRHKEKIFRDDANAMDAIREYEGKDTSILKTVLRRKYEISHTAPTNYYQIIDTMPYQQPNIDSVVKYKDRVFTSVACY
ncbi:MAG: hypothetical protein HC830_04135 [Bacteroidetes bacterium]|nr:hypothetical protein [Bacteroidota bacterium]